MNSAPSTLELPSIVELSLKRAHSLTEAGAPLREVLAILVAGAEQVSGPGSVGSILVIDHKGMLRNGASPNLPADYLDAIDRLKPQADVGTCASAAATGQIVVTEDFRDDGKWAELRHLPLALGYIGAWSMPIKDGAGQVLGTFGTYYRQRRTPSDVEVASVARLADGAATAIWRLRRAGDSATVTF